MSRSLSELREYLVGEWLFQNDFRDTSGNGNHGIPTDVEWMPTERGMKPFFNSINYITLPDDIINAKSFFTHVKATQGRRNLFFSDSRSYIEVNQSGQVVAYFSNGTTAINLIANGDFSNRDISIAVTINEFESKLYVNGVLYMTGGGHTIARRNGYEWQIGKYGINSALSIIGYVYDFSVYSDILTASEVLILHNSTKHAYGVQPAERSYAHDVGAVLSVDENTVFATDMHTKNADGTLIDLSGNSNLHLTTGNVGRDSGYFRDTMRFVSSGSFAGNETDFDNGTNLFSITALVRANNTGSPIVFNGRNSGAGSQADGSGYSLSIKDKSNIQLYWYKDVETTHSIQNTISTNTFDFSKYTLITVIIDTDANAIKYYVNGILTDSFDIASPVIGYYCVRLGNFNGSTNPASPLDGNIAFLQLTNSLKDEALYFNKLARLPLYSLDFSKHPSNTTVYDDFLPYSSARIASGSFKVNDDKLECVTDGQIVFRNAHEFDGDEYIKLTIDDTVYAGTGTITQGTVTASISQDSTAITVNMAAGDVLDKLDIQFRRPV